jgi:excisionase family DNA binding protein
MSTPISADEQYLRNLDFPQDRWVLSGQQWYTATEAAKYLAVSDEYIRNLAEQGAIPGAILHSARRIGWRLPREGLIHYVAEQRRNTQRRREGGAS